MPAQIDWVWHEQLRRAFETCPELAAMKGQPVRFLEIGVFQAGGAMWLLEEVLTHKDARYVGIDPFVLPFEGKSVAEIQCRAESNLEPFIKSDKAVLGPVPFHEWAVEFTRRFGRGEGDAFDAIYVDGSHHAFNVLRDSVTAWPLLKVGGVMFWDDYTMKHPQYASPRTKLGVDGFVGTLPLRSYKKLACSSFAIQKICAAITDNDGGV